MKPASQDQQPAGLERSVPAPAISTHGAMRHDKPGHLHVLLLLPTAATRLHLLLLHPTLLRALQDEDNDDSLDRPSIDTGGWDPGRQNGLHLLLLHPTLLRRDTTTTELNIRVPIPPLNPSASMRARQDEDNDDSLDHPSIDTCCWDPGRQNGLHLLLLHPTILHRDATTTDHFLFLQEQIKDIIIMNISLPQINPRFNACSAG
jgi:hypothetical protein